MLYRLAFEISYNFFGLSSLWYSSALLLDYDHKTPQDLLTFIGDNELLDFIYLGHCGNPTVTRLNVYQALKQHTRQSFMSESEFIVKLNLWWFAAA